MALSSLKVKTRKRTGKSGAREARREGSIPAVLYGRGEDPVALAVAPDELRRALSGSAGINTVLELEIDGPEPPARKISMVREIQRDPVGKRVIHLDFMTVSMERKVRVSVPVKTRGRSEGERLGGRVERLMRTVELECLPGDIPDSIEVDVSGMGIGDFVDTDGLPLGEGIRPLRDGREKVVQVVGQRAQEQPEEEEAEAEKEEQS